MITPATPCHVCQLAVRGLREGDLQEIKAALGCSPEAALFHGLKSSTKLWAAIGDHGVYAIFGVGPLPDNPSVGIVWLLAHEEFPRHRKEILTTSKPYAEEMGKGFKWLMNVIDARHVTNLRWLKWVGFTFDHTFPEYGVAKIPFIRFVKEV